MNNRIKIGILLENNLESRGGFSYANLIMISVALDKTKSFEFEIFTTVYENINLIKEMVKKVEKKQPSLLLEHTKVNRPWGWFEILDEGANYKVKRIVVKPNSKLSYQAHKYRSEHWVVLKGKASILRDKEEIVLLNNESTFIKKGMRHQLKNNQKIDLEIIEVQTGNKISEEDIIRYDDEYGRI